MALLEVTRATKRFGGLIAVNDLDFSVDQGAIVSVIGPNGAGKTTFFNCIAGFYPMTRADPVRRRPDPRLRRGPHRPSRDLPYLPEHPPLSEHDGDGEHPRRRASAPRLGIGALRFTARPGRGARRHRRGRGAARYVGLQDKGDLLADNLPYGDQRRLENGAGARDEAPLLLLDEPTAGMNPQETHARPR